MSSALVWPRKMDPIKSFTFESDFFTVPCYEIEVEGKPIRYVGSTPLAHARLTSLFDKEPTTIPWLEQFRPGETFVDIGANIGMYSVYAAAFSGCKVFAFEPEALNYAELNKNIHVNGIHDRAAAFCLALSDESKVDYLNLGTFGIAYSHHDFAENTWVKDMDWGKKTTPRNARLRQGCVSTTLDILVNAGVVPVPDHVKIDVDGLEHKVVAGCRKTFERPEVQTVLIEIDFSSPQVEGTIDLMTDMGWKYSWDQLRTNRSQILSRESIERLRTEKRKGMNFIFFRDKKFAKLFADFLANYRPPWPVR
ncbi:MAG: FkbM family methyltransferase [Gammaproteobacteria bacterium]